ncbi:MAG: SIS domain-containing protein [Sphaerochaeta sp.]|nr:SIS domain-containing protein [Sphaerochaeta sp.]
MKSAKMYLERVTEILGKIENEEKDSIDRAARLIADRVEKDHLIHVFGSGGHSIMGAMEVFWRAGGFANVNPLFPAGLSLVDSHPNIERTPGIAGSVLRYYGVGADDVLLIINVNGINPLTIESAMEAKKLGAHVISITSPEFASNVPKNMAARHPSNKNLHDLSEVVVDVHVPAGDSVVKIPGLEQTLGATSTYAVCFAANLIFIRVAEILVEKGFSPPIWTSANVAGGDEANKKNLAKYLSRVHHLYPMF